jgi:hypothetical protein
MVDMLFTLPKGGYHIEVLMAYTSSIASDMVVFTFEKFVDISQ